MCIKNGKSRVGDKREPEEHKDSDEPKLTKARKMNDESGKYLSYAFYQPGLIALHVKS